MVMNRRRTLAAVFVGVLALAALVLREVVGTVFFTVTVAYLLAPLHRRFVRRGFPPRIAAGATAVAAAAGFVLPLSGVGYLVYARREVALDVVRSLPGTVTVSLGGFSVSAELVTVRAQLVAVVSDLALGAAAALPVVVLKATVFALLLFALVVHSGPAARAVLAPVPESYHDVVRSFHDRTRETLYAIYVLQAVTAAGTFFVALPTFWLLGYHYAVTLALVAAALQFVPIVGPSVVIVALTGHELLAGDPVGAATVAVVGLFVVAWLPDALIRPRLAQETAGLPGSLYFVGFVGGLLTIGPVGIIAGPLAVALVVEAAALVAAENGERVVG